MIPPELQPMIDAIIAIKWALVCIAVSLCGVTIYLLLKEIPKWWKSFGEKEEKTIGFKFNKK